MRRGWLLAVALSFCAFDGFAAEAPADRRRLEVLARYALPAEASPMDLRWAGKDSVILVDAHKGVREVRLKPGLPAVREVLPPARKLGFPTYLNLVTSPEWVLFSGIASLGWKRTDTDSTASPGRAPKKGGYQDFDVRGDEVILLGFPDPERWEATGWGGMIWRSRLSDELAPWELVHESEALARKGGRLTNGLHLGSIRFLRDGRFVAAPNMVPGVFLFSSSGSLKRTWTPEELWGEPGTTDREYSQKDLKGALSSRHLIEEVLPLPQGPAIVVRDSGAKGARWRLGVLGAEIEWYDIPVTGIDSIARLRGDVDERGRIALVGAQREVYKEARLAKSEVIVLTLPD